MYLDSRIKIIYVLKQANPDLWIIHYPGYYHSDHINVSKLVFEALYLSNLKLWKTEYPLTERLPYLYYMDTLAGINFELTEYIDISETIDTKIEMMMKVESQLG